MTVLEIVVMIIMIINIMNDNEEAKRVLTGN